MTMFDASHVIAQQRIATLYRDADQWRVAASARRVAVACTSLLCRLRRHRLRLA